MATQSSFFHVCLRKVLTSVSRPPSAQVGLVHVRDVIVGSPMKKGISGGERKRLCVAMELLTKPQLLFLVRGLVERSVGEQGRWVKEAGQGSSSA